MQDSPWKKWLAWTGGLLLASVVVVGSSTLLCVYVAGKALSGRAEKPAASSAPLDSSSPVRPASSGR
jgi:hypothetical protein